LDRDTWYKHCQEGISQLCPIKENLCADLYEEHLLVSVEKPLEELGIAHYIKSFTFLKPMVGFVITKSVVDDLIET